MNTISVFGRCTRDINVSYKENGQVVIAFILADNEYNGKEKITNFFRCVAFGQKAENLGNNIGQGTGIMVTGKLIKTKFTGKDGVTRTQDDIIVEKYQLTDKKETQNQPEPEPQPETKPESPAE